MSIQIGRWRFRLEWYRLFLPCRNDGLFLLRGDMGLFWCENGESGWVENWEQATLYVGPLQLVIERSRL